MTMEFINRSVQLYRQHSIAASNQKREREREREREKRRLTVAGQLAVPIPGLSLHEELDSTDFLRDSMLLIDISVTERRAKSSVSKMNALQH